MSSRNRLHHDEKLRPDDRCNFESRHRQRNLQNPKFRFLYVSLGASIIMLLIGAQRHRGSFDGRPTDEQTVGFLHMELRSPSSQIGSSKKVKCPDEFKKTFYVGENKKINQPPMRALRLRGWQRTGKPERAHII